MAGTALCAPRSAGFVAGAPLCEPRSADFLGAALCAPRSRCRGRRSTLCSETLNLTLTLSLSTHTHTHIHSHSLNDALTHSLLSLMHSLSHSLSLSRSHSHTLTRTHSHSHSHSLKLTLTLIFRHCATWCLLAPRVATTSENHIRKHGSLLTVQAFQFPLCERYPKSRVR